MAEGVKIGGVKRGLSRRQLLGGIGALAAGAMHGQIRVHRKPKPLPKGAVTHDWAAFLGPSHNAVSTETMLSRKLPPSLVWEFAKGTGYASPAVAGERLVFLHRLGNEEIIECLHPETASSQWQFRYATAFEDRYGYNNGPRSSPVIDGEWVYTVGAEAKLHCLELGSGKVVWKRDLRADYKIPQDFFGTAWGAKHGARARSGVQVMRHRSQPWCTKNGGCLCLREVSRIRQQAG